MPYRQLQIQRHLTNVPKAELIATLQEAEMLYGVSMSPLTSERTEKVYGELASGLTVYEGEQGNGHDGLRTVVTIFYRPGTEGTEGTGS